MWKLAQERFQLVNWNFWIAGHGKNSCDAHFSQWVQRKKECVLRKGSIETIEELQSSMEEALNEEIVNFKSDPVARKNKTQVFVIDMKQVQVKQQIKLPHFSASHCFVALRNNHNIYYQHLTPEGDTIPIHSEIVTVTKTSVKTKIKRSYSRAKPEPSTPERAVKLVDKDNKYSGNADATLQEKLQMAGYGILQNLTTTSLWEVLEVVQASQLIENNKTSENSLMEDSATIRNNVANYLQIHPVSIIDKILDHMELFIRVSRSFWIARYLMARK